MAICAAIDSTTLASVGGSGSFISPNSTPIASCTDYIVLTNAEYSPSFFAGVELVDVIEVSWLVVISWAAAWAIKHMGKGARR